MIDLIPGPDMRNGLGLACASLLWLLASWQSQRRGWPLIALWFVATSIYFAVRATVRLGHFELSWLGLRSPVLEWSVWAMNLTMVAAWIAVRRGWYGRDD